MRKSFVTRAFALLLSVILTLSLYSESVSASNDPVYDSMTEPSDLMVHGVDNWHKYGHVIHPTPPEKAEKILSMGDIYRAADQTLPAKFTVYIGKIKCFAYSKSKQRWICVDSQPRPKEVYLYHLPWESNERSECKKLTFTKDYAKIELTAEEMAKKVIHFWGRPAKLDKEDYIHFACAYDFWVDKAAEGKLSARSGVDYKDKTGGYTINQVFTSRCLGCTTKRRTHWSHSVPKADYYKYNTSSLNELYASDKMEIIPPEKKEKATEEEPEKEEVVVDKSLKAPKLSKLTAGKKSIKVKWKKKEADTTGYEIQYSTSKKFKKNITSKVIDKTTKNSAKIKKLKANKKYYVRIRSYKKDGTKTIYSDWSKIKSVTTK